MKKVICLLVIIFSFSLFGLKAFAEEDQLEYEYTEEELSRGILLHTTYDTISREEVVIKKVIPITEYDSELYTYLVIGSIYTKISESVVAKFPYCALYQEKEMLWDVTLEDFNTGEVTDALYNNGEFILLVNSVLITKFIQPSILRLDEEGYMIDGNSKLVDHYTWAERIFKIDNFYYIFGTSQATNIVGEQNYQNAEIIYGLTYTFDLMEVNGNIYGNTNGINELYDCEVVGDNIFLYCLFNGLGLYKHSKALVSLSKNLLIKRVIYVEGGNYLLTPYFHNIALIKQRDNSEITITIYDENLAIMMELIMPLVLNFETAQGGCGENVELAGKKYYALTLNTSKDDRSYFILFNESNEVAMHLDYFNRGLTDTISIFNNDIYIFTNQAKKMEIINKMRVIKMNGDYLSVNGVLYKKEEPDYLNYPFGSYNIKTSFDLGDCYVTTEKYGIIRLTSSVENDCIYDINHVLTFNGSGKLNNRDINSGHVITEEGNYVLIVTGKSGDNKIINFEVRNLRTNLDKKIKEISDIEILKTVPVNTTRTIEQINFGNIKFNEVVNDGIDSYFYYLIASLIGILLGLIIPQIKIRKKVKK